MKLRFRKMYWLLGRCIKRSVCLSVVAYEHIIQRCEQPNDSVVKPINIFFSTMHFLTELRVICRMMAINHGTFVVF